MARSIVYNGHSSVVPILDASHNGFIPIIKIKQEPIDDDTNDEREQYKRLTELGNSRNLRPRQSTSNIIWRKNDEILNLSPRRLTRRAAAVEASRKIQDYEEHSKGTNYDTTSNKSLKEVTSSETSKSINKSSSNTPKSSSRGRLKCEICYLTLANKYLLNKHLRYYAFSALRCRHCNKSFSDIYKIVNHRNTVHNKSLQLNYNKIQCDYCKLKLRNKIHLQQHICHHHRNEIETDSGKPNDKTPTKEKVMSPSTRLSTSDLSIRQYRTAKRKRTQSCSYAECRPIIQEHSINTRLNSERKSLFGIQADSLENVTPLLDKSQLSNSNSPKKSISSTKSPGNSSHPPLVQIYAIPNEVEALLNDCEDIPAKRMKLQVLSNKNSDNGTKIDNNLNKSSSATSVRLDDASRSLTRTIRTLKENFNCLDCSVKLEKLRTLPNTLKSGLNKQLDTSKTLEKSPEKLLEKVSDKSSEKSLENSSNKKESSSDIGSMQTSLPMSKLRSPTPTIGGTIGIQLENLDIALKKLKTPPKISNTSVSSSSIFSLEDINMEHSYSTTNVSEEKKKPEENKKPDENNGDNQPLKIKSIYLSSICRTRFTTQKKLIHHYLNYHSYPNYICAVCRTECAKLFELKKHLAVHCISIPKSLDDRSPIDLKGPCENSKKKLMCRGCKKCFPTLANLEEHAGQCPISEIRKEQKRHFEIPLVNDKNSSEHLVIDPSKEVPVVLQPTPSEDKCKEIENNQSEVINSLPPVPPTLPVSIPPVVDVHNNPINLLEQTLQNMERWSQYTHSEAPRQKPSTCIFQHQCKICYSRFQSEDNLNEHLKKFEPKNICRCELCGTCFPSIGLLAAHKKATHSIDATDYKIHSCLICDQGFSKKKSLHHHMMHIHCAELIGVTTSSKSGKEYDMTCRVCYIKFKSRKQFIEHSVYYYNHRTVTCDVCGEQFEGQYKAHAHILQVHFKEFYSLYTYSCKKCQYRFKYESHLQSHIFHVHKDQIVNTQCQNQHQRRQCFVCSTCTDCFYTPKLLKEHKMEFSNSGHYRCDECERKCETRRLLEEHKQRCHYDSVPHFQKCNLCSEFVSPKLQVVHFKHFHGNVPSLDLYMRNCSKSQSQQEPNVLNSWISTEQYLENVIEYTCAICDMKFKSDNELKEHRKSHKYNDPDVSTTQQRNESGNHDILPFTYVNHDSSEPEQPIVAYESDEDTKYNFAIANICSVELKEYDNLYNPETSNKEINSITDNFNHCDACHYNKNSEYSDHTYPKVTRHEATCNETLTARNVKQMSLPNVHREFLASNQPELIVKSKETAEVLQNISTSSAQSSLVSDPQSPQKKPAGTCKIQTTINQYFQKSPSDKNIAVLCDTCGLVFDTSSELIRHKNNMHHNDDDSLRVQSLSKVQTSSTSHTTNTSFSLPIQNPVINQNPQPPRYIIAIPEEKKVKQNRIANRISILRRHSHVDNFEKSGSPSSSSMGNNQLQQIALVDSGILYSYLKSPVK